MGWTSNDLRIEMKNTEAAVKAAEAIKNYTIANAESYKTLNLQNFLNDLEIEETAVVLNDSYMMHGCDYMEYVPEICRVVASLTCVNTFEGTAFYTSGYGDEGNVEFSFNGSIVKSKSVCYPNGFVECLCCEECGMDVVSIHEYEAGKIYICPECGEEIDLSEAFEEYSPEIVEKEFCIK